MPFQIRTAEDVPFHDLAQSHAGLVARYNTRNPRHLDTAKSNARYTLAAASIELALSPDCSDAVSDRYLDQADDLLSKAVKLVHSDPVIEVRKRLLDAYFPAFEARVYGHDADDEDIAKISEGIASAVQFFADDAALLRYDEYRNKPQDYRRYVNPEGRRRSALQLATLHGIFLRQGHVLFPSLPRESVADDNVSTPQPTHDGYILGKTYEKTAVRIKSIADAAHVPTSPPVIIHNFDETTSQTWQQVTASGDSPEVAPPVHAWLYDELTTGVSDKRKVFLDALSNNTVRSIARS